MSGYSSYNGSISVKLPQVVSPEKVSYITDFDINPSFELSQVQTSETETLNMSTTASVDTDETSEEEIPWWGKPIVGICNAYETVSDVMNDIALGASYACVDVFKGGASFILSLDPDGKYSDVINNILDKDYKGQIRDDRGINTYYDKNSEKTQSILAAAGEVGGNFVLGAIPIVGPVLSGFYSSGKAAETARQHGATDEEIAAVTDVAFVGGFVSMGLLNKVSELAKGAKTIWSAMGYVGAGTAAAEIEPAANAAIQYLTYGKDEYGFSWKGLDSFLSENGYYTQFALAGGAGFIRSFISAAQSEGFKSTWQKLKGWLKNEDGYIDLSKTKNIDFDRFSGKLNVEKTKLVEAYDDYAKLYKSSDAINPNISQEDFNKILNHAAALQEEFGDEFDLDNYLKVVTTEKGSRSLPTDYIDPKGKIYQSWKSDFSEGKAYCIQATSSGNENLPFDRFTQGNGTLGYGEYYVFGESTMKKINGFIDRYNNGELTSQELTDMITKELGYSDNPFSKGFVVIETTLDENTQVSMSTGREATANSLYTPYGRTVNNNTEGIIEAKSGVIVTGDKGARQITDPPGLSIANDFVF